VAACTRRAFLTAGVVALPGLAGLPRRLAAGAAGARALRFTHLHTGERLEVTYFSAGDYVPDALAAINHVLRDFRTGGVHSIEPGLLDLVYRIQQSAGASGPIEVISGFRSPATNAMLRARSEGVAAGSLHMVGKAIDLRVTGVTLPRLRDAALALRGGGVGYYPGSRFLHVDTGRVRAWQG
jgi:uncharacterized protein YcbK (DUF882 family)